MFTLCHSHHWYCAGNLYRLYCKVPLWTLVAEDPGTQGARALRASVLTQLSRNLSVSVPEGFRVVYITCRVSRYHDTFYYHIVGEDRGTGGWGLRENGRGQMEEGGGGGGWSEFWAGVPQKKKIRKKRGRGVGRKNGRGQVVEFPEGSRTAPHPHNSLSSRDSWVVNRIVTEVNHCSAALSVYMSIGPLSFESYHSSNEKKLINLSPPLVIAYH